MKRPLSAFLSVALTATSFAQTPEKPAPAFTPTLKHGKYCEVDGRAADIVRTGGKLAVMRFFNNAKPVQVSNKGGPDVGAIAIINPDPDVFDDMYKGNSPEQKAYEAQILHEAEDKIRKAGNAFCNEGNSSALRSNDFMKVPVIK